MPRSISAPFFSAKPVFDRAEYARAVGRRPDDKVVTAMLSRHLHAGNIRRIARGVFASVPKHADADKWVVDHFLAASRLRRGGVIAYRSALGGNATLEVDVNYMARQPLFGAARMDSVPLGGARTHGVLVLDIHEIVAGKLAALVDRHAARDLFDARRILSIDGPIGGR